MTVNAEVGAQVANLCGLAARMQEGYRTLLWIGSFHIQSIIASRSGREHVLWARVADLALFEKFEVVGLAPECFCAKSELNLATCTAICCRCSARELTKLTDCACFDCIGDAIVVVCDP